MNRRTFTLAGFFGAIGAAIGKVFAGPAPPFSESAPHYPAPSRDVYAIKVGRNILFEHSSGAWQMIEAPMQEDPASAPRKAMMPEGIKHWSEAPQAFKLEDTSIHRATIGNLEWLQRELETLSRPPPWDTYPHAIRDRVRELSLALLHEIHRQAMFCSGHNGPSPLGEMTEMPDGRRLCPYCYKQETDHGLQLEGSDRGQASSA